MDTDRAPPRPETGRTAQPRGRNTSIPSSREFYSGLAVLTALAAVAMMRGGTPEQSMAGSHMTYAKEGWGPEVASLGEIELPPPR